MERTRVFIVEDQPPLLKNLVKALSLYPELEIVGTSGEGEDAVRQILALMPQLVPRVLLPRAIALSSSGMEAAIIGGPALGGVLYVTGASTVTPTAPSATDDVSLGTSRSANGVPLSKMTFAGAALWLLPQPTTASRTRAAASHDRPLRKVVAN